MYHAVLPATTQPAARPPRLPSPCAQGPVHTALTVAREEGVMKLWSGATATTIRQGRRVGGVAGPVDRAAPACGRGSADAMLPAPLGAQLRHLQPLAAAN